MSFSKVKLSMNFFALFNSIVEPMVVHSVAYENFIMELSTEQHLSTMTAIDFVLQPFQYEKVDELLSLWVIFVDRFILPEVEWIMYHFMQLSGV